MMAHPLALQLRNLQSLVEIGVDKNTTVVFPAPLMTHHRRARRRSWPGSRPRPRSRPSPLKGRPAVGTSPGAQRKRASFGVGMTAVGVPGTRTLDPELLHPMDAYWRAANYLSVGQIYLYDNPLLKRPLALTDVKPLVVGHWGTTPGQNFIYVHLNRVIKEHDLDMFYVAGPGHGGPALVANTYLEGTYSEVYPDVSQDEAGMKKLFTQFSFPGGISSHVAPTTPGSIHEGGELGYSLSHAFGAAFDNPDLIVACVIGDGEAETGPLATAWHSNKFLDPVGDGAVLPILHLNGYKISNPTMLARIEPRGAGPVPPRLRLGPPLRRGRRPGRRCTS